jgi:hypothetical protein
VPQVIIELEVGIVHPDRPAEQRNPCESLEQARRPPQPAANHGAQRFDVERTVGAGESPSREDADIADVHVDVRRLQLQEAGVESGQALGVRVGHGGDSRPASKASHVPGRLRSRV